MKSIKEAAVGGKRVFLRVDFNVPMQDGKISDNSRIVAALPTIQYLSQQGAKVIVATHLGRPEGMADLELSTVPLAQELARLLNRPIKMINAFYGPEVESALAQMQPGEIMMLENLRFHFGEDANDIQFAQNLVQLAEIYCNDAFAVSHRKAASLVALATLLPSYAGLRLETEINSLRTLLENPKQPLVLIIGGAKVKDKALIIGNLADKISKVLFGGAVANTFLLAKGEDIGDSVFEQEMVFDCKVMLERYGNKIVLPVDAVREEVGRSYKIFDIGPKTAKLFAQEIGRAQTIFWNGNLGVTENEKYAVGTRKVAEAISRSHKTSIVAGGDTIGFISNHNLAAGISFLSTGGGAALEFLAGKVLPGIAALDGINVEPHFGEPATPTPVEPVQGNPAQVNDKQ